MRTPSYQELKKILTAKGYPFYETGDYNLNLIGIRSKDLNANAFNDLFIMAFKVKGVETVLAFDCTTDPGMYYRNNPANVNGTGWVKPGHYPGVWALGKHQGKYTALVQVGPITVYRDNDKDGLLETGKEETGLFGVNCHRASETIKSSQVDKWSAACQVIASPFDFQILISNVMKSMETHPNKFSYTLLNETDTL